MACQFYFVYSRGNAAPSVCLDQASMLGYLHSPSKVKLSNHEEDLRGISLGEQSKQY